MPEAVYVGLDLGTQSARALAVTAGGDLLAAAARPLQSRREGPRHEQSPADWWDAVSGACREALAAVPRAAVQAVAVCATSGTIVLVDYDGTPLTAGLMYDDARAHAEAEEVNAAGAELWARLGYGRMPSTWALPKLLWLLRRSAPGARLAHQVDVVTARLAGRPVATDSSHALKTGYDLVAEDWPDDVLSQLGVPREVLPLVVRAGDRLGEVSAPAAEATGLPAGTSLFAGMTDGCAAQIGSGRLRPGCWNSVLGTTLVVKGVSSELVRDPAGLVYSHRAPDGEWLPGGASSTGAAVLSARFPGRDLGQLDARAAEREPASVIAYPLLAHGERFPFRAPEARGFVLGEPVDEADGYAALLQGIAFVERLTFDYLDRLGAPADGELTLTGGGTHSRYWCALRADVLGRTVRVPESAEAGVGMAVLAAAGLGGRPVADVADAMVRTRETFEPRSPERWRAPYLRLVEALQTRGWLDAGVAEHAFRRAEA